eukprot:7532302-Alexandrium_andersonii.AAC.1
MADTPEGGQPSSTAAPFRALSRPLLDGRRTMSESALTRQLGATPRGAPNCCVKAPSLMVQRPSGAGSQCCDLP